ncbi:MAG: hypothetical protein L3J47_00245 [Sulfurovum sp.]|nr:hypothetical protein [Sulfurovum sp.]
MSKHRKEANEFRRKDRWTMCKFLPLTITAVVILFAVGFGVRAIGAYGNTVVERKVFENSYQRSESLKAQIAIDEATLTEITHLLTNPNLAANSRSNLEAQASAARIRLATTKRKQ